MLGHSGIFVALLFVVSVLPQAIIVNGDPPITLIAVIKFNLFFIFIFYMRYSLIYFFRIIFYSLFSDFHHIYISLNIP